jgi:hypothetical protein
MNIPNGTPFVKSVQGIIPQFRRSLKDIAVPTKVTEPEGEISWKVLNEVAGENGVVYDKVVQLVGKTEK